MRNERTSETLRRIPWRLVLLCGGTLLLFGAAAPASADSNFERGFEHELGRILAHEAVNAGKAVLFHGVVHPYADHGYQQARHGYSYDTHRRHRYVEHKRRHRGWKRRHHRHHGHSFKRYVRDDYYYDDDHRRHRKHKKHRKHHRGDGCNDHY